MQFNLAINLDNAAFRDELEPGFPCGSELARILRELADEYDHASLLLGVKRIKDINGGRVGFAEVLKGTY
jgi:hypothetical protein